MSKVAKFCGIKFPETNVYKLVNDLVGTNDSLSFSMKLEVENNGEFTEDFINWYKDRNNTKTAPSYNPKTKQASTKVANAIFDYYYYKHPSISKTVNNTLLSDKANYFGYSDNFERENGKHHAGTFILDEFNSISNNGIEIPGNKRMYYLNKLREAWLNNILNRASFKTKRSVIELREEYNNTTDKVEYLENLLTDETLSITDTNLLAVYKELNGTDTIVDNYINEIFNDNRLQYVLAQVKNDLESETIRLANEATRDENENRDVENVEDLDDVDVSITTLNNHIGIYSSFMTHVGSRIKNYFNTLRKLSTPEIDNYNTDNTYGIADTMDANACCSMIYNNADKSNLQNFIKSIKRIGETVKGFESFVKFAYDLENNLDFATEILTVFSKAVVNKFEVVHEEGNTVCRISNTSANPKSVMTFNMLNDIRSSIEDISIRNTKKQYDELYKQVYSKSFDTLSDEAKQIKLNKFISDLIALNKVFFPSVSEISIKSYIQLNNGAGGNLNVQLSNIKSLLTNLSLVIRKEDDVKHKYAEMQANINEVIEDNRAKKKSKSWNDNNYRRIEKAAYIDYTEPMNSVIQEITDKLLPYSVVDVSFNSRNIYGNSNSDVINMSWCMRISNMLKQNHTEYITNDKGFSEEVIRNEALENWGKDMFRSNQYLNSNLLLEHRDENGNIINYGIFKYVNNVLCITDYASQLIDIELFNGSSDIDKNENSSYADMNSGDYTPTSFMAFFKTPTIRGFGDFDGNFGTYFLRTPSDAQNIFGIKAPKYDTKDLFRFTPENKELFDTTISNILSEVVTPITYDEYKELYASEKSNVKFKEISKITSSNLKEYLMPNHNIMVRDNRFIKPIDDEGNVYYTVVTNTGSAFILKGEYVEAGNGHALKDAELVGAIDINFSNGQKFDHSYGDDIYNFFKSYYEEELSRHDVEINGNVYNSVKKTINTDHRVFKMMINTFNQELIDAATALNHYFVMEPAKDGTYHVRLNDEHKPDFKPGMRDDKGFKFYHLNEKGKVLTQVEGGVRLDGAVFGSNKFTLITTTTDNKGNEVVDKKNYLDEVISRDVVGANTLDKIGVRKDDGSINLLYGGGMRIVMTTNTDGNLVPTSVILSEAQQNRVNEAMTSFITDYIQQVQNAILAKEDLIRGVAVTTDNIREYAMNQILMHYTYDELFEGNTKFYKDSQTILKRAKEYQGSGVPYGIVDYINMFNQDIVDLSDDISYLNGGTTTIPIKEKYVDENGIPKTRVTYQEIKIQDLFKGTILEGTKQRNNFKAVTVVNTITDKFDSLKALKTTLLNQGLEEFEVDDILYGKVELDKDGNPKVENGEFVRSGGFTDTKVNDAQSYITVQEWVRRIFARGQGQRYMPLIKKLINPNYVLNKKDIKEFVQVQKNFYFDNAYNEEYGIHAPRQIKNAEFVLVPQLIKGTQLEQVYNLMRDAEIDQLNTIETSKASNEVVLTLWDKNGDISVDKLNSFAQEARDNAKSYSYAFLYTQQETPQHMAAENKAGIQFTKKVVDNIDSNSPLYKDKQEFFKLMSYNIIESFNDILDEFNVSRDENGNIIFDENGNIPNIDMKVLYSRLEDEVRRSGLDNNTSKFVIIEDGSTRPDMPSYINNYITKFESIFQSIFNNNITRQKLPGFHAPQITNVGWKSMDEDLIKLDEAKFKKNPVYNRFANWINDKKANDADFKGEITFEKKHLTKDSEKLFRDFIKETIPSYAKKLKYHPVVDGEAKGYIEVVLPYSYLGIDKSSAHYKNMSDDDIIKELIKDGNLDEIIGYRIPTEGKQSICSMKVVGFIDNSYGSTIIVPDEWVAQTGSDFDVDSVYGIQYATYKDKDGKICKINYKRTLTEWDYFNYIRRFGETEINTKVNDKVKKSIELIKAKLNDIYEDLHLKEELLWKELPEEVQDLIKEFNIEINKEINAQNLSSKDAYVYRLNKLVKKYKKLAKYYKGVDDHATTTCNKLSELSNDIQDYLLNYNDFYRNDKSNAINEILANRLKEVEAVAKKAGLVSYEEYTSNPRKYNSKKARSNEILSICQKILNDNSTLEETLYRSNFEDLVYHRNRVMNDNVIKARKYRSPYNVLDQIAYQEEVMSGAKLKAMSVSLDTFCSVCNNSKPILEDPITVIYEASEIESIDKLKESYDVSDYNDKEITITHNTYGWSKNNRGISGRLITAYSSETTAFILDAVKEGSLPNVNEYTFSVFKTLANLGLDYRASLAFIMSPAVTEIVNANNIGNSIFSRTTGNPIHLAIRNIAQNLDVKATSTTPIVTILNQINAKYNEDFKEIFGITEDIKINLDFNNAAKIPINVGKLVERIKGIGEFNSKTPVEKKALFDLANVLVFNRLNNIARQIGDVARCCNPDKFGAKQSVFATRQVFKNIDNILYNTDFIPILNDSGEEIDNEVIRIKKKPILSVNGNHLLESIYPGIDNESGNIDKMIQSLLSKDRSNESSHPILYSHLRCSSALSTLMAKTVIETENPIFTSLLDGLVSTFSGSNPILDEETYNDFKKYVLSSLYKQVSSIKYPVRVSRNDDGSISLSKYEGDENTHPELVAYNETSRIYGYERPQSLQRVIYNEVTVTDNGETTIKRIRKQVPFKIADLNNPQPEEIEAFEEFSPAQKVQFIKANFSDPGIFQYLRVNLDNRRRNRFAGMQTIEFTEQNLNSNVIYNEFEKAFYNTNPLVVSAAIDLIKYSVQVEGLNMSFNAINKVISNKVLINEFGENGIGFVDELREFMNNIGQSNGNYSTENDRQNLYRNYLRSHPRSKGIRTLYLNKTKKDKIEISSNIYNSYIIKKSNSKKSEEANINDFYSRLEEAGIVYYVGAEQTPKFNKYIRIQEGKVNKLYKVLVNPDFVYLYPLGNLQPNENSEWSTNEEFNERLLIPEVYERIFKAYEIDHISKSFEYDYVHNQLNLIKDANPDLNIWYKKRSVISPSKEAKPFNWNEQGHKEGIYIAKTAAENYFSSVVDGKLYILNNALGDFIRTIGINNGSQQEITLKNGQKLNVQVYKSPKNGNSLVDVNTATIKDDNLREIVESMISFKAKTADNIYEIIPLYDESDEANASQIDELDMDDIDTISDEDVMHKDFISMISKVHSNVIEYMSTRIDKYGDDDSRLKLHRLNMRGITAREETIANDMRFSTNEIADYSRTLKDYIKDIFNNFVENPNELNTYLPITSPVVRELIKKNKNLRRKYLMACNIATDFISIFSPYSELDAQSEVMEIRDNLNLIKENIEEVRKLPVKLAQNIYNQSIAEELTTNPLIKEGIIDVMDGYWRSYGPMWKFNDIMENGTPLLQIVLKDVMGDIQAKKQWGDIEKRNFNKKIETLYRKAKERGETINFNKFIDDNGVIARDYSPELILTLDTLRINRNNAAKEFGYGSIEHLKAKLEYDYFKAKHFNQEAKPEYYIKKCKMVESMINMYPKLFERYSKLYYEKNELYKLKGTGDFSESNAKRLDEINKEIRNLTRPLYYYDESGTRRLRPSIKSPNANYISKQEADIFGIEDYDEKELTQEEIDIYSVEGSTLLASYIQDLNALESKYYDYNEAPGFRKKLDEVLRTIINYERPDANGIPTVPISELNKIPAYREAVEWRDTNARMEFIPNIDPNTNKDNGLQAQIKKAFEILKRSTNHRTKLINEVFKEHNNGEGIYDSNRIPDGRLLSDKELQLVKESQENTYGVKGLPPFTDRILISSGKHDNHIYSADFYNKLRREKDPKANARYLQLVTQLNKILEKYYNEIDGLVHFEQIPDSVEGIEELNTIADLYQKIRIIKHDSKIDNSDDEFLENEVEFVINENAYNAARNNIVGKTRDYKNAMYKILYSRYTDGNVVFEKKEDGTIEYKPNSLLFGYIKPKNEEKYIDKEREWASQLLDYVYVKKPTKYYEQARTDAMRNDNKGSYAEWYHRNHVYNPFTRQIEPLSCWLTYEVRDELIESGDFKVDYRAVGKSSVKSIKKGDKKIIINGEEYDNPDYEDMRNPDYKLNKSLSENYHKGSDDGKYDNKTELNQSEIEMRDLIYDELMKLATVDKAKRFFEKGNMPVMRKNNDKTVVTAGREALKMLGINIQPGQTNNEWTAEIGHEHNLVGEVPMTNILKNKQSVDYDKKIKDLNKEKDGLSEVNFNSDEEKIKKENEIDEKIKYYKNEQQRISNSLRNKDWIEVMNLYIEQMSRFNAIQDNVENLYHLLNVLRDYKMYNTSKKSTGRLKQAKNKTTSDNPVYEESIDDNLIVQYENFIRRLVFDQWKEDDGRVKIANAIQGFTSANYMMLNLKGGVANVTLGESGILAEAAAQEFLGTKDWAFGTAEWNKGVIGFARRGFHMDLGEDVCFNKQDAIVRLFNVVDYDEKGGVVRELPLEQRLKKLRDAMFSPQNIGEHYMQNSVLFGMLHGHKLVTMDDGTTTYMNKFNYMTYKKASILSSILSDSQKEKFEEFKNSVKKDKNTLKDYAWFRKDLVSRFLAEKCTKEERQLYAEAFKKKQKQINDEFDQLENMYDQMEFVDGQIKFKEGSVLAKLDEQLDSEGSDLTKAYALIGRFTEKVRKVNNKIHGVYNKDGRAYIESKWYGSLIMQYHKHLPMGLIKHYMRRGHWNEFRESVDKGRLESLIDIHRLNMAAVKADCGLTDDQLGALEGFIFMLRHIGDYLQNLRITYNIMPDYDKNNAFRGVGNYIAVGAALLMVAALWSLAGDDDDLEDAAWFNFFLYESDRLASEAFLYHPFGAFAETKKLMSSPIAAKSIIDDGFKSISLLSSWLLDDEFDPYYHSGRFAGQHKLSVYIQRRIPIWSAIHNHLGLNTSNHYYKLGENPIGLFNIKEAVTD